MDSPRFYALKLTRNCAGILADLIRLPIPLPYRFFETAPSRLRIGIVHVRSCRLHRQPDAVVGERPSPEPGVFALRSLLAQGLPKKVPMDFRCLHGTPLQANLLPPFFGQRSGVSVVAFTQMPQTLLEPSAPRPVPILCRELVSVIGAAVHPALSKDYFP